MVIPSAKVVGCITGRSAGLSPLHGATPRECEHSWGHGGSGCSHEAFFPARTIAGIVAVTLGVLVVLVSLVRAADLDRYSREPSEPSTRPANER